MKFDLFSFRKHQKLLTSADFERVFFKPRKLFSQHFVFFIRKNHLDYPRLGFAISVKKVRKSVTRNFLKRIIRESFRLNQYRLSNFDIVVIASTNAAISAAPDLRKSVNKQWERIIKS